MKATLEETTKANQITKGIGFGCLLYFLIVFFIIPFTFLFWGPEAARKGSLFGGIAGERPTLDGYLFYSIPFIILFLGVVLFRYFKNKNNKPAFAKSLLITSLIVIGLYIALSAFIAIKVYS